MSYHGRNYWNNISKKLIEQTASTQRCGLNHSIIPTTYCWRKILHHLSFCISLHRVSSRLLHHPGPPAKRDKGLATPMAYDNCLGENLWDWLWSRKSTETKNQFKIWRKTCTVSNYFVGKLRNTQRFLKGPCQICLDTTSVEAWKIWILSMVQLCHSSKHFHNFKATSNICTQITQLDPKSHPKSSPEVPMVFAKQGAPNIWQPNQRTPQTWPGGKFRAHEFRMFLLGVVVEMVYAWIGKMRHGSCWELPWDFFWVLRSSDWNEWQHQWWKQEYPLLSMMVACENIGMSWDVKVFSLLGEDGSVLFTVTLAQQWLQMSWNIRRRLVWQVWANDMVETSELGNGLCILVTPISVD